MERTASHYLGEAEAVVEDALQADASDAGDDVVRRRVDQARELLSNVDETGDDRADEHVAAAKTLCDAILADA